MKKSITKIIAVCIMMLFSLWEAEAGTMSFSIKDATPVNNGSSGANFTEFGRYYMEIVGKGKFYRQPSAGSSIGLTVSQLCETDGKYMTTTSSTVTIDGASQASKYVQMFISPDYDITSITLYSSGNTNSSARTLSTVATLTKSSTYNGATGNYSTLTGTTITGTFAAAASTCQSVTFTCAAGTFIPKNTYILLMESGSGIQPTKLDITYVDQCTTPATKSVSGSAAICSGNSTNVTLTASQNGVGYDLYKDGSKVAGTLKTGDGNDLTWSVSTTGTYTVKTNSTGGYCDGTAMTGSADITVNATTSISSQSTSTATYGQGFGSPAALTVNAAGAGLGYQWYQSTDAVTNTSGDDVAVGTNSNSYTPSTATMGTSYYYCVVTGSCGSATSAVSGAINIIAACTAPTYSVQPTDNQTECVSGTVTLGTVAADQSPTYQWYSVGTKTNSGGTSVGSDNGGNSATYTPVSSVAGTFYYYCVATSGACYTASDAVQITVYPTNPILSQSTPAANYGQNATATSISVTTIGTGLSYQWYSSTDASTATTGDDVTVGTNSNSFTPPTTSVGTTYYYCVVSGGCSSPVTSNISGAITVSPYAIGDIGSVADGAWATAGTWKKWDGSGWNTTGTVPTSSDNVWITNNKVVTLGANGNCKNLTVESGQLTSTVVYAGGTTIYTVNVAAGGKVTVNGGVLGSTNSDYSGTTLSVTANGNLTIDGSGGTARFSRIRCANAAGDWNIQLNRNMTLTYTGSSGNGGMAINSVASTGNSPGGTKTFTIGDGTNSAVVTLLNNGYAGGETSSSGDTKLNTAFIISNNATLDMSAAGCVMNLRVADGFTTSLTINNGGILKVASLTGNGANPAGVSFINNGTLYLGPASGTASSNTDFTNPSLNISGTGTTSILNGCKLLIGSLTGVNGHFNTSTVSVDDGVNYTFTGTEAQVTGSAMPAKVNNFSISNATGVSLSKATEISGILTVDAGSTLKNGGYTLTNSGTANINGAFQIDEGGWATGNNFVYGTAGSLIFNNATGPYGVSDTPVYWPATSGPVNVTVQNTGGMELQVARTITGIFQTSAAVKNTYGNDLTVPGTVRLNSGGYFDNFSPTYSGAGSTLEYNTGGTYGVYNEWGSGSSVGYGVPQNVTVNNATTVNLSGSRNVNGTLALTSGSIATGSNVLMLNGAITGTGTINTGVSGTLSFAGTSEQTLASANVSSGALNNLVISSASKLTTSGSLSASNLTINSDANGTGSLKGTLTSTNATVNQSFQHAGVLRTWYVTPPVESATPSGMSIIKSFDETNNSWSANTSTMLAKVGYQVVPAGAANDIAFNGTLNSGNQTITLTGRTGSVDKAGFNLIGNPYPAYLNWDLVTASTPNTNSMRTTTMWYRTKLEGAYSFWTVNGDGISVPATASKYIPPMQAFWVRAIEGGGSLALTSDMTTHAPASDKLLKAPAANQSAIQLLRLQVSNGVNTDEAVIYFSAKASNDLDKIDAPKMSNENAAIPEIYTTLGSEHIVINAMNSIPLDLPIGLGFVPGSAVSFSIKATEVSNLPSDVKVILKDNVTLVETDLTDGTASYQFSPETTVADRFSVIFRSSSTTTAVNNNNVNGTLIYWNNLQGLTLKTNDEKLMGSTLSVYNAVGQQLLSKKISGTTMNIDFPYAPDMYIVKINNVTTKVIVK